MTRKIVPLEERCEERVSGTGTWGAFHPHRCGNRAIVVRDGKRYCKIHDPEYIRAKRDKQEAEWDQARKIRQAHYELENMRRAATEGLTLEELRRVTPDLIRRKILNTEEK